MTTAQQAWAVCNVTPQGVNFGPYDTFSSQNLDGVGSVGVTCNPSASYSISLSPGTGSYASRTMVNGARILNYNLYTNPARSTVWGDGVGGTAIVSSNGTTGNHPVYGRIPARQNAHLGSYSDTIIVTVTF